MTDAELEISPEARATGSATGTAGQLESRIAAEARVPSEDVRDVFATYGLPLVLTPARPRALQLHRLRIAGVRAGEVAPGPFDTNLTFQTGMTALVASNFRGKTSVLELITWCLRGTPRELQSGVRHWLRHLDLDATVAGQPLGFRLDLVDGEISAATVLTAPDVTDLADAPGPDPARHITTVFQTSDATSYSEHVASLMMDRLDLSPVVNTLKDTSTQTHGWPMYFGAVYLGSASTKVLLGEHAEGGQASRLLQVFLDLPAAAVLTRVKAAHDVRANQAKARQAEERKAADARAAERQRLLADLDAERARLAELTAAAGPDEPLADLARTTSALAARVADARATHDEFVRAAHLARGARQQAVKRLADVRESGIARALFQGLDPTSCPRCDQAITGERRQEEQDSHACAVCARPVPDDDPAPDDVIGEAEARLADATTAERDIQADVEDAKAELDRLTTELTDADDRLRRAQSAASLPDLLEAQTRVWRLEGGLAVLPELPPTTNDGGSDEAVILRVLAAAAKILEKENKDAATQLFSDLNAEIADLARRFGMKSLEEVAIDRGARLRVIQDGGAKDSFSGCSSGARLRLRIAVIIALLRVGADHGVSTHPGLIMIDSPKAEEVQDLDAGTLFRELSAVAAEQGIQLLITTRDYDLVHAVLDDDHIIEAPEGQPLW